MLPFQLIWSYYGAKAGHKAAEYLNSPDDDDYEWQGPIQPKDRPKTIADRMESVMKTGIIVGGLSAAGLVGAIVLSRRK